MRPTVLEGLPFSSEITRTEIFGPVLSVHHVETLDEAIALVNAGAYGNQACLFTIERCEREESSATRRKSATSA